MVLDIGHARRETPLVVAAPLVPTPLWRPVALLVAVGIPLPLATNSTLLQPTMELHFNPSSLFGVVVVEGALAARLGFTTAAVHAVGRRGAEERRMELLNLVRRNHWLMSDREVWETKVRSRVIFIFIKIT
jgi:hypothetical protein